MTRKLSPANQAHQDAVLAALQENYPGVLRVGEIASILDRGGIIFPLPGNTTKVRVACERLTRDGLAEKLKGPAALPQAQARFASGQETAYRYRADLERTFNDLGLEDLWDLPAYRPEETR